MSALSKNSPHPLVDFPLTGNPPRGSPLNLLIMSKSLTNFLKAFLWDKVSSNHVFKVVFCSEDNVFKYNFHEKERINSVPVFPSKEKNKRFFFISGILFI